MRGDLADAWSIAAEVSAAAYGVPVGQITAPSRGRGPRPPKDVWQAKKMAVHVAVTLADCDYASLGRLIGLHRDTIASHCAEMRNHVLMDDVAEVAAEALELIARAQLEELERSKLDAARVHVARLKELTAQLVGVMSRRTPHPTLQADVHPTNSAAHENVIKLARTRSR